MIKIFTFLFLSLAGIAEAISQPTINQTFNPLPGDTYIFYSADSTGVQPGSGGTNQTWDFGNLNINPTPTGLSYVNSAGTPYAASFPTATVAANLGGGAFQYFKTSPTDYRMQGLANSTYTMSYSNDQIF